MTNDNPTECTHRHGLPFTRRMALSGVGAMVAVTELIGFAPGAGAQTRQSDGMSGGGNPNAMNDIVRGGGLLVVAEWLAKDGQADAVAGILHRYLPLAQNDPGVKLFLIARGKENPAQFLFYELFTDDAALAAHQASAYFKTLIAGQALALLSKRERTQYALL